MNEGPLRKMKSDIKHPGPTCLICCTIHRCSRLDDYALFSPMRRRKCVFMPKHFELIGSQPTQSSIPERLSCRTSGAAESCSRWISSVLSIYFFYISFIQRLWQYQSSLGAFTETRSLNPDKPPAGPGWWHLNDREDKTSGRARRANASHGI